MVLITGGAGYIGSNTCIELLAAGFDLVVLDNLSNSSFASLERVAGVLNVEFSVLNDGRSPRFARDDEENYARYDCKNGRCERSEAIYCDYERLTFIQGDIRHSNLLRSVFERFDIEAAIHFFGLKAVCESMATLLRYYDNNV